MQGEDVVAGIRTPEDLDAMRDHMPEAYVELVENCEILEGHYKDMMVCYSSSFCIPLFHCQCDMSPSVLVSWKELLNPKICRKPLQWACHCCNFKQLGFDP
jgi:hypothetical protein